jgi:hypothetical protein
MMYDLRRYVENTDDEEITGAATVFLWASISTVLAFLIDSPMYVVALAGLAGGFVTGFLRGGSSNRGASGGFRAALLGAISFVLLAGVSYFLLLYYATRSFFLIYAPTYALLVGSFLVVAFVIGGIVSGAIGSVLRYFLIVE